VLHTTALCTSRRLAGPKCKCRAMKLTWVLVELVVSVSHIVQPQAQKAAMGAGGWCRGAPD
jgi:hypothetical protein